MKKLRRKIENWKEKLLYLQTRHTSGIRKKKQENKNIGK